MPFFDPIRIGASGAVADFTVDRSLRFNDGDSPNLSRTPSGDGNKKKWTWSSWIKISANGTLQTLFSVRSGNRQSTIFLKANGQLQYFSEDSGGTTQANLKTDALVRDPSAWYHVVVHLDAANTTGKIYLNGVDQSLEVSTAVVNTDHNFNTTLEHVIGNEPSQSNYFDGYMAEVNFIDGQALTPSSFAETDSTTGQWNPIDTSGLTFGTNGFRLKFADNSGTTATTLGKDSSGNGNNYTPNNLATTDAVKDSPTNNFCTLNINDNNLSESSPHFVYSEGNLKAAWSFTGTNFDRAYGTLFVEGSDTNKYYWEATGTQNNEQMRWGVHGTHTSSYRANNRNTNGGAETDVAVMMWQPYGAAPYLFKIDANDAGVALSTSNGNAANGDIFGFVFDGATGKFYVWFKGVELSGQNFAAGTSLFDAVDSTKTYALLNGQGDGGVSTKNGNFILNWGQDSSFAGSKTAQGNTDANGIGDFYYSVPSGAKALCSKNLPDPTILLPNNHFNTVLYTGNSSNGHAITGVGFQPDWTWIKVRTDVRTHSLIDAVRGAGKILSSNNTNAEYTDATAFASFDSDGFTVGTSENYINDSSHTYVGWNWNAGDTDGKTYAVTVVSDSGNKYRFDGFGTSAVTLDLAEGGTYVFDWSDSSAQGHPIRFSTTSDGTHGGGSEYTTGVVKDDSAYKTTITVAASAPTLYYYCQNHSGMGGQVNTNSTLGSSNFDGSIQSTAKVNASAGFSIITYTRNGSSITVGHGLGVAPKIYIRKRRDSSDNWIAYNTILDGSMDYLVLNATDAKQDSSLTVPTSTKFYDDGSGNMVVYAFSEVAGYSKFGSYTGNGIADGTFVFTGFRPAWVMVKRSSATSASSGWLIYDNKRNTFNQVSNKLAADSSEEENDASTIGSSGANDIDFLSNGFKARATNSGTNASGNTYIYLAFAEAPFRNARAR